MNLEATKAEIATMEWAQLLSKKRFGDKPGTQRLEDEARSAFEADYDRVIFSTAFRRLQDKTQVIPLPKSDFVHTRLTHSLEVSSVGRSLGKIVGKDILAKYPELKEKGYTLADFGSIVATAALAHDIGNPPFGHSGEKAISEYFLNGNGKKYEAQINDSKRWADLIAFEGNANGFRIMVNPSTGAEGGLRLTYACLAAFTKYPKEGHLKYGAPKRASEKKFGFFQSEKEYYRDIAESAGLRNYRGDDAHSWTRHPLAFLVEAADDICYSIIDFEDGLRLGLIDEIYAEKLLVPMIGSQFSRERYEQIIGFNEKISYLRAVVIGQLINDMAAIFLKNEEAILSGEYDRSLIKDSQYYEQVEAIKAITLKKVYRSKSVLEIESAGFEVISGLLDLFLNAVNDKKAGNKSFHSLKNFDLLPEEYLTERGVKHDDLYHRILAICDYIAGMTDSAAISLYRKLKGIELPNE